MKKIVLFLISSTITSVFADNLFINVFAITDDVAGQQIAQANQQMRQAGVYSRYGIEPFADEHKVHLTMYLTNYPESQLANIESTVGKIADNTRTFPVASSSLSLQSSNYLMLDVVNTPRLQSLSDKVVGSISGYRDTNVAIPAWANAFPMKVQMFRQYGSPNVYEEFDPHFSIFAAKISPEGQIAFESMVNNVLTKNKFESREIQITGLGIGVADSNGQIVKVLKTYSLKK